LQTGVKNLKTEKIIAFHKNYRYPQGGKEDTVSDRKIPPESRGVQILTLGDSMLPGASRSEFDRELFFIFNSHINKNLFLTLKIMKFADLTHFPTKCNCFQSFLKCKTVDCRQIPLNYL